MEDEQATQVFDLQKTFTRLTLPPEARRGASGRKGNRVVGEKQGPCGPASGCAYRTEAGVLMYLSTRHHYKP